MGRSELGQRHGREGHSGESEGEREEETRRDGGHISTGQCRTLHPAHQPRRQINPVTVYTHDSCQEPPQYGGRPELWANVQNAP